MSAGGSKKEVNTQTVGTVLQETDLDAVIPQQGEPLKSALKQSAGEVTATGAPKETDIGKDEVNAQEDGAKDHADPVPEDLDQ